MTLNMKKQQANPWLINPSSYHTIQQNRRNRESPDLTQNERRKGEENNSNSHSLESSETRSKK
jgi:hypothetical protein